MATLVALLRGINVGGRNAVSMPALKELLTSLGLRDVTTYIQSGNVVFGAPAGKPDELARKLERQIAKTFAVNASVLLRTPAQLKRIAAGNPFVQQATDRSKLHVVFLDRNPGARAQTKLDPERSPPDEFVLKGREIYLHLPNGAGRTKLTIDYFERRLGVKATHRNWNTLNRLIELSTR
jgi:uncharacterized protein (DUF1697 family)